MASKKNNPAAPGTKPQADPDSEITTNAGVLDLFHPVTAAWFRAVFEGPTAPQIEGWPAIARGESTLILAPTGTGKTLTAFLWCLDRLMLQQPPDAGTEGCRVLYVSPLKALAVDVERNLRSPLAGIANMAQRMGVSVHTPTISVRTGDTPANERARFARHPGEILITTPESLYLMLTSNASEALRSVETIIIDEIHALVPTKRGAHMALSIERLQALANRPLQRIGLSATQRPLEEVARFLGGADGRERGKAREQGSGNREQQAEARDQQTEGRSALDKPRPHKEPTNAGLSTDPVPCSLIPVPSDATSAITSKNTVPCSLFPVPSDATSAITSKNPVPCSLIPVPSDAEGVRYRPVTIVSAGARKQLLLTVEVPVEDMARLGEIEDTPSGPASQGPKRTSIWQSIHPRLLELIREHQSTILFVNARRIAERLAGAINELAEEQIARAHHGSLAAAQRSEIEELLKAGSIRALVATSSLELGIDMGAVDLVIQIEAPPSVASGMQRIGRAGHQVGAPSKGIIFPKYRADLIACAAVTQAMHQGHVEQTRFQRNALDVLAQHIVAIIAHPPLHGEAAERRLKKHRSDEDESPGIAYDQLLAILRSAAGYADLNVPIFEGVLDMLAGRYPSDEFGELRPRITWDRTRQWLTPRQGVKRIAILNGGTIPDRGLYGVFLSGASSKPVRVGELDEEMVFESRTGDTFLLGASTWRIDEISHDRVLVSPAPGEPGKMPFWRGEQAGRPLEFGRRIGVLIRELRELPRQAAVSRLIHEHDLDQRAAENVLRYLADQEAATEAVPDDRTIVVERVRDELGDWRVCILTPFGSRIHAPWAMAVSARIRSAGGSEVETMWSEDGFVVRFPENDTAPDTAVFFPEAAEAADLVQRQLGSTALFAAKFREAAARALLLPRRRADGRTPLWQQRKRAYDLLSVAARYPQFPMLLEAYRECLRDVFDMPALAEILRAISARQIRVHTVDARTPSPFASALLFSYVANYIYDGDAPLAERRAQALSIDQDQLRELLGDADLRELLDIHAIEDTEAQLQLLADDYRARTMDGVHDMLLRLGDLNRAELLRRVTSPEVAITVDRLLKSRRILEIMAAGEKRLIAAEDAARYRDALGIPLPPGLPTAFLEPAPDALTDLLRRYARTHGPFTTAEAAHRFALPLESTESILQKLVQSGRIVEGGFRPGGLNREWCDVEVLRTIRRKSLARLRKEVEPVEQQTLARLFTHWQGVTAPRRGLDALLDVIETLQGAPLPASILETEILPARLHNYKPSDLDTLIAAGEVQWAGLEPIGEHDGRIALYLSEKLPQLWPATPVTPTQNFVISTEAEKPASAPQPQQSPTAEREEKILHYLRIHGASFFQPLHDATGGGYPGEAIEALWNLVWQGRITNDGLNALRAYTERPATNRTPRRTHQQGGNFRSRRTTPPTVQGRWALHPTAFLGERSATEWSHAEAHQLLHRYGVVFRETAHAEGLPGGFSAIYDVMKALEESGRIRRGYFAADLGATQFALPAAVDLLRSLRTKRADTDPEMLVLAATDPANPYGALLRWPAPPDTTSSLTRSVGARVILADGALAAYLRRGNPNLQLFLPEEEPARTQRMRHLARFFVIMAQTGTQAGIQSEADSTASTHPRTGGMLIQTINGTPVAQHPMARILLDAGFQAAPTGFNLRRNLPPLQLKSTPTTTSPPSS